MLISTISSRTIVKSNHIKSSKTTSVMFSNSFLWLSVANDLFVYYFGSKINENHNRYASGDVSSICQTLTRKYCQLTIRWVQNNRCEFKPQERLIYWDGKGIEGADIKYKT